MILTNYTALKAVIPLDKENFQTKSAKKKHKIIINKYDCVLISQITLHSTTQSFIHPFIYC